MFQGGIFAFILLVLGVSFALIERFGSSLWDRPLLGVPSQGVRARFARLRGARAFGISPTISLRNQSPGRPSAAASLPLVS